MTALPVETEFDSKAQAVVHGSVEAVPEQDLTTFEATEGMAVFDDETRVFWVAAKPTDKSGVVYDELSETDKIQIQGNRKLVEFERSPCQVSRGKRPLYQDNT